MNAEVFGIAQTQLLLIVGICWVPIVILGILGFAVVLRREGRPSALSFATAPPIRLGTLEMEREGAPAEVEFQWAQGRFVAADKQVVVPTVVAELDGQGRVHWASDEQREWFRKRFVDDGPGTEQNL